MAVSQASGIEPPWSGNTPVANCRHIQYGKKLKGALIALIAHLVRYATKGKGLIDTFDK